MAFVRADNVVVDYPLIGAERRRRRAEKAKALGRSSTARLSKGGLRALAGVSFELKDGERLGVLGLNGAGKSTLLSVLAGVIEPVSGQVERYGRTVTLFNFNVGTEPDASGMENLRIYGLLQGMTLKEIDAIAESAIEFAELGEYIHLPLRTYSSGMRMRLALAVATSIRPDILLMDEWVGMGDQRFMRKVHQRLSQYVEQAGILVLASHNRKLIEEQCNLGLVLDAGEARFYGPVGEALAAFDAVVAEKDAADGPGGAAPTLDDPDSATARASMTGGDVVYEQ
jgi:ABC-type polysaccharide/polyol phosphate transport system ATPase subunit